MRSFLSITTLSAATSILILTGCGGKSSDAQNPWRHVEKVVIAGSESSFEEDGTGDVIRPSATDDRFVLQDEITVIAELEPRKLVLFLQDQALLKQDFGLALFPESIATLDIPSGRLTNESSEMVLWFDFQDADIDRKEGLVQGIRLSLLSERDAYDFQTARERSAWKKRQSNPVKRLIQDEEVALKTASDFRVWFDQLVTSRKGADFIATVSGENGTVRFKLTADKTTTFYTAIENLPEGEIVESAFFNALLDVTFAGPLNK